VRPCALYVLCVFCVMCALCEMCFINSVFFLLRFVYFFACHFACVVRGASFACGCDLRVFASDRWCVGLAVRVLRVICDACTVCVHVGHCPSLCVSSLL